KGDLSVFETNIRFVGGLLSAFALTKDRMFLRKGEEIADLLLPAFDTPTGIPYSLIDVRSGKASNFPWASSGCSILAEFGTLQLEFDYLSNLTGNFIYSNKIVKMNEVIANLAKPSGLVPMFLNPHTGRWGNHEFSMGAMADSYYEYLLKKWLIGGKKEKIYKQRYDDVIKAMEAKMLHTSEQDKLVYFAELNGQTAVHQMEHLACFSAGMFALQAMNEESRDARRHYMSLAEGIGHTCHESYARSNILTLTIFAALGLGPEKFSMGNSNAEAISDRDKYYILRPEAIEG
ncbi:hypothetical protein PFISCL1PPCAC_21168, partial [Pristionchus fissidentatus]